MTTQAMPGQQTQRTVADRQILNARAKDQAALVGVIVDGTNSYDGGNTSYEKYIRGGAVMAQDATSKKWVPLKRTFATAGQSANTALVVNDANAFVAGDSIIIGEDAAQDIVSINYGTKTITLTSAATWVDNAEVYVAGGQGQARGILVDDEVSLWNHDKSSNVDATAQVCIGTLHGVNEDNVLGDLTAALEDPTNLLGHIVFDDYQLDSATIPEPGPFLWRKKIVSGNATLTSADSGYEIFANAAATITLPALASAGKNFRCRVINIADTNLTVTAPANTLVAFNDATATSVSLQTASEKIGSGFEIVILPDETLYVALPILGADSATVTIA